MIMDYLDSYKGFGILVLFSLFNSRLLDERRLLEESSITSFVRVINSSRIFAWVWHLGTSMTSGI
jgi:hypothetical protein